jgi:hypothetical protein
MQIFPKLAEKTPTVLHGDLFGLALVNGLDHILEVCDVLDLLAITCCVRASNVPRRAPVSVLKMACAHYEQFLASAQQILAFVFASVFGIRRKLLALSSNGSYFVTSGSGGVQAIPLPIPGEGEGEWGGRGPGGHGGGGGRAAGPGSGREEEEKMGAGTGWH